MTGDVVSLAATPRTGPSIRARAAYFAAGNVLFLLGAALLMTVVLAAFLAPVLAPYDPTAINFVDRLQPPSLRHLMGTTELGGDIFSQVLYGARTSLFVGALVVCVALALGVPMGLLAGYLGGAVDTGLMRIADIFLAFPPLLLPIAITAALGTGIVNAAIALAVSWFPWYARIVRGAVMRVCAELYVPAARAMGVSSLRIMLRHCLPNALGPVIVQGSLDFGYAILAAASLSFIGIGAQPPTPEWGLMAAMSRTHFIDDWWTVGFPGLAMFVTVLAVNLVGDGLRDLLDPKNEAGV
ncbi:MAG TPA: ABC transporter permease [Stellaceae bacterium]|nr:ABC transporter permease [Stellaceae bacterium]